MSSSPSLFSLYSDKYNILPLDIAMPYFIVLIIFELFAHWHHWRKHFHIFSPSAWGMTQQEGRNKTEQLSATDHSSHKYHQKFRPLYRINDAIASLLCGVCEQLMGKLILSVYALMVYSYVYHYFRVLDWESVSWATAPLQFILLHILAFFCKDYGYYWFHREIHEVNLGWSLHAPHHNSEEYNLTTALRQGMFQSLAGPLFYIPSALLGIPPAVYSFHTTLNLLWQFWIHTRMIKKFPKWFEFIFNTPSHHRVHHGRNPEVIDKNYGGTLIIFDRLHGTFEEEQREVVYGTVHPIQSFNPLTSQFHHLKHIISSCASRGFAPLDWFKICFYRPAYDIETDDEFPLPDVDESKSERYNPHLNWCDTIFSLVYLLHATVLGVLFIAERDCTVSERFSQWTFLFSGLISLGYMIDGCKYRVRRLELLRFFILIVALFVEGRFLSHVFPMSSTLDNDLVWIFECSWNLFVGWYTVTKYSGDAGTLHEEHVYRKKIGRFQRSNSAQRL